MTTNVADLLGQVRDKRELPPPTMRRAIREAAGLSRGDIAKALGVSKQAVGYWEDGTTFPSRDHLGPYAALLRSLQQEIA